MTASRLLQLPTGDCRVDPVNPRTGGPGDISELAASIAEVGVLNPLLARPSGGGFGVLSGQRRLAAAVQVGLEVVPAIVHDPCDDTLALTIATAENVGRKAMNPIEEARAFKRLLAANPGWRQGDLAEQVGTSEFTVSTRLQLLNELSAAELEAVTAGTLPVSRAYENIKARRRAKKGAFRKTRATVGDIVVPRDLHLQVSELCRQRQADPPRILRDALAWYVAHGPCIDCAVNPCHPGAVRCEACAQRILGRTPGRHRSRHDVPEPAEPAA